MTASDFVVSPRASFAARDRDINALVRASSVNQERAPIV
jgi:hypothetical protein